MAECLATGQKPTFSQVKTMTNWTSKDAEINAILVNFKLIVLFLFLIGRLWQIAATYSACYSPHKGMYVVYQGVSEVNPDLFWIRDMFHLRIFDFTDTLTRKLERRRKVKRLNPVAPLSTRLSFEDNLNLRYMTL